MSSDSGSPKKGHAAIIIGAFVVLALAVGSVAFYYFYWRRRHPVDQTGAAIVVGTAVTARFNTTEPGLCYVAPAGSTTQSTAAAGTAPAATGDTGDVLVANGVVTAINGTQATVQWLSMYNLTASTAGNDACQWVKGASKTDDASYFGDAATNTSPTNAGGVTLTIPVGSLIAVKS